jgi:transposase-like protein
MVICRPFVLNGEKKWLYAAIDADPKLLLEN